MTKAPPITLWIETGHFNLSTYGLATSWITCGRGSFIGQVCKFIKYKSILPLTWIPFERQLHLIHTSSQTW